MATTKRKKVAARGKKVGGARARAVAPAKKAKPRVKAKPAKAAKTKRPAPKASLKAKVVAAAKGAGASVDAALTALKARFDRERGSLERRLTETVREIGQLRHHELRVGQLERQLAERDETIRKLRAELDGVRDRTAAPRLTEEQPSLVFGSEVARDLDSFDDDGGLDDEDDLI